MAAAAAAAEAAGPLLTAWFVADEELELDWFPPPPPSRRLEVAATGTEAEFIPAVKNIQLINIMSVDNEDDD